MAGSVLSSALALQHFKNGQHHIEMSSAFASMMEDNRFCDVVITAENCHFNCHKMVLSATCPYFRIMFSAPFEENQSNAVEIKEIKASTMRNLISYLYKGEIEFTVNNAQDIIFAADMFQLDALKAACSQFLQAQLRTYNCLGMWNMARQLQDGELEEQAWNLARSSFARVTDQEEFLDLSAEDVSLLVSDTKVKVHTEESICKSILKWLQHKPERATLVDLILKNVHLTELNPAYIKTFLMVHPLLTHNKELIGLLQRVLDHVTMNMPCPSELPTLAIRENTDSVSGVILLGGKVNRPMVRTHECTFVTLESLNDRSQCCVQQEVISQLPATHKYTAACSQGNTVYISGMGSELREMYKFDSAKQWTKCEVMKCSRNGHTLVSGFTGSLFAVGGSEVASDVSHNIAPIEEYNVTNNSWRVAGVLLYPVCYAGATFYKGHVLVMGGFLKNRCACAKIQMFDTQTGVCVKLEARLPRPMAYCKGIAVRNNILLIDKEVTLVFDGNDLVSENTSQSTHPTEQSEEQEEEVETCDDDEEGESDAPGSSQPVVSDTESVTQVKSESENPLDDQKANDSTYPVGKSVDSEAYPPENQLVIVAKVHSPAVTRPKQLYLTKTGCGVELAAAECLGNKLLVFGGRRDERDLDSNRILSRAIKMASVEEFLAGGSDAPVWETVGRLGHAMIVFMTAKLKINRSTRNSRTMSC